MKRNLFSLLLIPFLLLSCGALWQSDTRSPVELARTGNYKEAAAALEPMVAGGNFEALVVESVLLREGDRCRLIHKCLHQTIAPLFRAAQVGSDRATRAEDERSNRLGVADFPAPQRFERDDEHLLDEILGGGRVAKMFEAVEPHARCEAAIELRLLLVRGSGRRGRN